MRMLVAVLASVVVACGGGDSSTAPKQSTPTGSVVFKVDAQSCTGTAAIDFFIDGSLVGTEQMTSGGSSKSYTTTAGQHIVGARTSNATTTTGRTWPSTTVTVPVSATYTALLTCV